MRAAQFSQYGGPAVVTINDTPSPELKANFVMVQVKAGSLNPFDTSVREGKMQETIPLILPVTIGGDIAGVITDVGDDVTDLKVGDSVYGEANVVAGNSGAFADFAVTKSNQVSMKPSNVTFEEAASLPLTGVSALQAVGEHLNLQPGQKIFIHGGAGGIGSLAIQVAKHVGAYVATTARPEDGDYVRSLGADEIIDYTCTDFREVLSGYDAVFDTVGGDDFAKTLYVLKKDGAAVSMIAAPDDGLAKQLGVKAMMQSTRVTPERLAKLTQLVESGAVKPQVAKTYTLSDIVEAFKERETGHSRGKIVITL